MSIVKGSEKSGLVVDAYVENTYGITPYATKYCADYSSVYEGTTYDDWFLPSRDELNEMDDVLDKAEPSLGGFTGTAGTGTYDGQSYELSSYWRSTEFDASTARDQWFSTGTQYRSDEYTYARVRLVRAF